MEDRLWNYLWESPGLCPMCATAFNESEECQRCMDCLQTVHQCCLFQDQSYERIPVCLACQEASSSTDPPPLPPPELPPPLEDDGGERPIAEQPEPELLEEDYFTTKLQDTGSMPCKLHGMDHLSRDPECEFCKKALGPMYRHLNHKYGMQIADHTPTLSFDFSGPLPIAVTGARILMVFVWRLQDIRFTLGVRLGTSDERKCVVMFAVSHCGLEHVDGGVKTSCYTCTFRPSERISFPTSYGMVEGEGNSPDIHISL